MAIAVTVLVMPSYRTEAVAASVEYSIRVLARSRSKRERDRERERERERISERERTMIDYPSSLFSFSFLTHPSFLFFFLSD